jgi:hypothetical protein
MMGVSAFSLKCRPILSEVLLRREEDHTHSAELKHVLSLVDLRRPLVLVEVWLHPCYLT